MFLVTFTINVFDVLSVVIGLAIAIILSLVLFTNYIRDMRRRSFNKRVDKIHKRNSPRN